VILPPAVLLPSPANASLDWPAVAQVFTVERVGQERGVTKRSVRYRITSLPPTVADAARLLALKREHGETENGLHGGKEVTLGEDRSQIRKEQGPDVLAMLRDTALDLLCSVGCRTIAARLRHYCRCAPLPSSLSSAFPYLSTHKPWSVLKYEAATGSITPFGDLAKE